MAAMRVMQTPLGALLLSDDGVGLCEAVFLDEEHSEAVAERRDDSAVLCAAETQLHEYFAGERRAFDLPLSPQGTTFQRRVWHALDAIPFGTTRTYQQIADAIDSVARPVGSANGKNPIAVIVPCHRVVGAQGLVGYAWGLWRKQWLLAHETEHFHTVTVSV